MFRRARHQNGSLQRVKRKSGDVVWVFRWYETQIDGSKKYRKAVVGTVDDYKTEAEAQNAVDALRLTINEQTPRQQLREISFETLVEHYRQHEMPDIYYKDKQLPGEFAEDENRKSYATQDTYQGYLKKWILPRWKSYRLPDIKAGASRAVAEVACAGAGKQGEDQEHHERPVQPRPALGMDQQESNFQRSSERKAQEHPSRPHHRADPVLPVSSGGSLPHGGPARFSPADCGWESCWASSGKMCTSRRWK